MAVDSPCGDWEPYKDEKCFKIFDKAGVQSYENAEKTCHQQENSSTLITIHSREEQDFLSNLMFKTKGIIENVWIGAKYNNNKIKWDDNSDAGFTNWAVGSSKNEAGYDCIQMLPDGTSMGKWANEPCRKNNLAVCQKMQAWSLSRLQKILLDARKELTDSLNGAKEELKSLKQNPVPIGFIYVQLPSQPEPKSLWSTVEWKDVTSEYAGLFFRAGGGGSAAFGEIQSENSPRLTNIQSKEGIDGVHWRTINILPGVWSERIYSGSWIGSSGSLMFFVTTGEVRPRNKAIRIWKRTK